MYCGYKIVSVTPAGRKKYLELLVSYLLENKDLIDEHHFWLNTEKESDINYIRKISEKDSFFKVIESKIKPKGCDSIYHFFEYCTDPKTIYIRFDDDICYIHPNAVSNLLAYRIQNPKLFLTYPIIINNSMNVILHPQLRFDGDWWTNNEHVKKKHSFFLDLLEKGDEASLFIDNFICHYDAGREPLRFNINCICWFGRHFALFNGRVDIAEELWLSGVAPRSYNKHNGVCGNSLVSHFSFHTQKIEDDIYDRYKNYARGMN